MRLVVTQLVLHVAVLLGVGSGQDCEPSWIGDGICDALNNNADCDWDGGDCCECTCSASSHCGLAGFDACQEPGLPCTPEEIGDTPMCGGYVGVYGVSAEGIEVCCDQGCSQCGRSFCGSRGLGVEECCTSRIVDAGIMCEAGQAVACILPQGEDEEETTSPTPSPTPLPSPPATPPTTPPPTRSVDKERTCSNGLPGVDGVSADRIDVCCPVGCAQCGGYGCARTSQPDFGAFDCCTSRIVDSGLICGQNGGAVEAPCMIAVECDDDGECQDDQICCPIKKVCESPLDIDPTACGDPHMTGFHGQKFDFTGIDGEWYALFSSPPSMHINMRVSTPLPELPTITYITGLSVVATDSNNVDHSIVIQVKDPSSLDSACPAGVSPCLANGALSVLLDETEALLSPGSVNTAPGVAVSAVNLPGACRTFGFEHYWERKQEEYAQLGRRLDESSQTMAEWVLGDPTATNPTECAEYVARAVTSGSAGAGSGGDIDESGLFSHQSEHASFKIVTPQATIRLTHGKLHQIPMRDPTDTMDLPDHVTWQMNLAIDSNTGDSIVCADGSIVPAAKGILGETSVPTQDEDGEPIMEGMESIRGTTEQYRVEGPLSIEFDMDYEC